MWVWTIIIFIQSVQSFIHVQLFAIPWTAAHQASLSITNSWSLLKLMSIESVMPSNHLILCRSLLLLPSISPSIRVFSSESVLCIRWPKYWSFSFSISPSSEYSGLISFRIDWLNLLVVQWTPKSLLQHSSSKASVKSIQINFLSKLVPCRSLCRSRKFTVWLLKSYLIVSPWSPLFWFAIYYLTHFFFALFQV